MTAIDVVIPTIGRSSLGVLLASFGQAPENWPQSILIVDDREDASTPLDLGDISDSFASRIRILKGKASGPASARNIGFEKAAAPWIAFLDDDVIAHPEWLNELRGDLETLEDRVAASQGNVRVPLPQTRKATDWERNVACLEHAQWITADMAYRRSVLQEVRGFDERFRRAFREDSDLALRVIDAGYEIVKGARSVLHPVRPSDRWISVRLQAGNADDALMRHRYGRDWRQRANETRVRFPQHLATTICGAVALCAAALGGRRTALGAFALWAGSTFHFAWQRIMPGPKTSDEVGTMLVTSAAIPFAAVYHRLVAGARLRLAR
ncbi:MAG: glycosyltransferase [Candidatus Eremiobacteraeota bacterium]|nr:glycosyltransferase [Candidatus Eremiobacteraeota bacterium]